MAKIVDPDQLSLNVNGTPSTEEVAIDTDAKTVQLRIAGNLNDNSPGSTSGATKQCIYSFLKEEWKTNATLNKFKFPLKAIYEAKFIWQYGWQPADDQTRDLFRDAGWQEIDGRESACLISLGSQYDNLQQGYYAQVAGFTASTTDFDKTGPLNEGVQIKGVGGTPDYTGYHKSFLREWERTYSDYEIISEQGFSALTYIAYRIPLANANDIKNDGTVTQAFIQGANDPYQDMEIQYYRGAGFTTAAAQSYSLDDVVQDGVGRWARCTTAGTVTTPGGAYASFGGTSVWEAFPGERQIGPNYYAFNRAIQYNGVGTKPTKEQIYLFGQDALTLGSNINDDPDTDTYGTVNGNVAVRLSSWVGDILHSWPGLAFDNFNTNDTNSLVLNDIRVDGGGLDSEDIPVLSDPRTYPFTAAGNMVFSDNLVAEEVGTPGATRRVMYFKNIREATRTDFSVSAPTGPAATLNTTAGDLSNISSGDYFLVSGFTTNDDNNGVKEATGNGTTASVAYTDAKGRTQVIEAAGDSVTVEEQPYDTESAIIVDDNSGTDIDGAVSASSVAFDFNYDGNVQGGRDAATPAKVVVVAQGLEESEWIDAEFTILRSTGLTFPVNAGDERTYLNPL